MAIQNRSSKILSTILVAALCLTPELVSAAAQQNAQPAAPQSQQQSQPDAAQTTPANTQQPADNQQPSQQNRGTTVDPTQAPLQPVTTYPEAPTPQEEQTQPTAQPSQTPATTTVTEPAPKEQKQATEPVGAAAAEKVPTAGGAASKPAGAAIAPAKQHQTRSLLIKIGAIAAGGIAAGTIYALSKGTSSKPPNSTGTGVTQK
jgi:cytoskeletal protein RodZ